MTDALARLMARAIVDYGFRLPIKGDDGNAYLAALIEHVADHDLAAAHELRIGKPQAQWTPQEVTAFRDAMMALPGPRSSFAPQDEPLVIRGMGIDGLDATDDGLRRLARVGLDSLQQMRLADPTGPLPIFASVLTTSGELITTTTQRSDRVAVLKALVQRAPVFGFLLVFDAFMHQFVGDSAIKTDALVATLGTRERRIRMCRPYHLEDRAAIFDAPWPDMDLRGPDWHADDDPYAEIFVSVPPGPGTQPH